MYEAHFGLTAPLVAPGIARDGRVFTGDGQRHRLTQRIARALGRANAVVVLSGPAGTGKTTLAAHAVRERGTRLALGWIAHAPQRPADLLEQLLLEFDVAADYAGRAELLRLWQQYLNEMAVTETSVCIVVEHADELGPGVLRALESLTAADANGCPGASLVLLSRANLAERLRGQRGLEGLVQRMNANLTLAPLEFDETRAYLEHAFTASGATLDAVLDTAAVEALHMHSGGIVRLLDTLAESALTLAAERNLSRVDADVVDAVAVELGCASASPAPAAGPARATAAAPEPEETKAEAEAEAEALEAAASSADDELADVPVLTDAVDDLDDGLLHDALASEALAEPQAPEAEDAAVAAGPAESPEAIEPDASEPDASEPDASEPDASTDPDADADAAEGLANALAFEDFSNFVAESVFEAAELDALDETLSVSGSEYSAERKLTGT